MMNFNNLLKQQNNNNKSGLDLIEVGYVAYLGATPKPYYPKLKDDGGNKIKDEKGNDLRAETPSGVSVSFATIGDNPKIVSAVFDSLPNLEPMHIYQLTGYGYDIKSSNFIWLEMVEAFEKVELA